MKSIILCIVLIFLSNNYILSQTNYLTENYGNLSILLSGNVTGSVEDLGLTYYNPARLAIVENPVFTINAKAYQWNRVTLRDAVGISKKLSSSKFNSIPSMVAGAFKVNFLEDHYFAFSFISKVRTETSFNLLTELKESDFLEDFVGDEKFIAEVDLKNELNDEWFGLTWAKALSKNLSIGISTFVSIYNHTGSNVSKFSALHSQDQVVLFDKEVSFKQKSYGLFWKLGIAWKNPNIEFGLNISPPYLELISKGELKFEEFLSGTGSESDIFIFNDLSDLKSSRKVPLGIDFGTGISIGKSKLHLNFDWHSKIATYDRIVIPELQGETGTPRELKFIQKLNSVFNYGLGAEIYFSPKVKGILSFSSDYSSADKNSNIFDLNNNEDQDVNMTFDMYHFGYGVEMKLKRSYLIFGGTYSTGNSVFEKPIDAFTGVENFNEAEESASLELSRWRFIIGIDIPIFNDKLKKLID